MDDLDLIKEKINIVDLIGEYLPLKKSGINYKANCPFHQEKTPSFMVSPERGIWHCFGCQKGGDHFKFLIEKEGIEFADALEILAKRAGIALKKQPTKVSNTKQRLYEANQKAAQFYHYLLTEHKLGQNALEYLKKRGLTDKTIKEFNLGYAPNSWDSLHNFLKKKGFAQQELVDAGLIVPSAKGGYDRFRGRIIFPLVDIKNQVVGFAGRILETGKLLAVNLAAGGPKYINTPQTAIFDKSHFLFGLNLSKGEIRNQKQAILTEGEMDMILSYQAGVKNVVATKGTALTSAQIELLKRFAETILLSFDTDLAGDSASRRGIEMADSAGLNIKMIVIPEGKDPAEAVLKDPQVWEKSVLGAENIYDYYLQSVSKRFLSQTPEGKRQIATELLPILTKISDSMTQEHYIQKLAALIATPEELIRKEVKKRVEGGQSSYQPLQKTEATASLVVRSRRELLEEYLLTLLLKIPSDITFVPNFPETIFLSENYRCLYVLLVLYLDSIAFKGKAFQIQEFIKNVPEEVVFLVDRLYLKEIDGKLSDSKAWQQEITVVVGQLKKALVKASLEKLSAQIKNAQAFGKIEALEVLNRRFRDLSLKLKTL